MGRDVVSLSRSKEVMVLFNFLTVESGQKRQQETPVFVISHSASIITFPWGTTNRKKLSTGKGHLELGH
jgi:hypothetical protein